jgi:hypothetical protein
MSTRRLFRSNAISPPASKVTLLKQPFLFWSLSSVPGEREARRPTSAPCSLAGRPFAATHLVACPSILPRRKEQLQPHVSRRQRHWLPVLLRQAREFLQPGCPVSAAMVILVVAIPKNMLCKRSSFKASRFHAIQGRSLSATVEARDRISFDRTPACARSFPMSLFLGRSRCAWSRNCHSFAVFDSSRGT